MATPAVPHAGSTAKKLESLLAFHLKAVENLQGSIALLNGTAIDKAKENGAQVLSKALELDAARHLSTQRDISTALTGMTQKLSHAETRQRTAAALDALSRTVPRQLTIDARGSTVLQRTGYITRQGGGWVRTAKPFYANAYQAKKAKKAQEAPTLAVSPVAERGMPRRIGKSGPPIKPGGPTANRWRVKQLLDKMSRTVPKTFADGHAIGALALHGYLKRKGDGYIRTAKPYHVSSFTRTKTLKSAKQSVPHKTYNYKSQRTKRRQHSAQLLAAFNPETAVLTADVPGTLKPGGVGSLVRRGYLKKSGEGYVRTDKEFVV